MQFFLTQAELYTVMDIKIATFSVEVSEPFLFAKQIYDIPNQTEMNEFFKFENRVFLSQTKTIL